MSFPGDTVEVLAFPLIVVHPDHVAVRARELRVRHEHRLHVVVAGRHCRERLEREAEHFGVDYGRRVGAPLFDVEAEEGDAATVGAALKARLTVR